MSNVAPTTHNVVVTRIFEAPIEQVWKAWSEPESVRRWWGPQGFTCHVARLDFREGGVSLVGMRAPEEFGGMELYNTWTYRKIDPTERIEFSLNFTDKDGTKFDPAQMGMPLGVPPDVSHVITFKAVASNKMEMTVTEYGYATAESRDLSQGGLEQCLDKMAAIFVKA